MIASFSKKRCDYKSDRYPKNEIPKKRKYPPFGTRPIVSHKTILKCLKGKTAYCDNILVRAFAIIRIEFKRYWPIREKQAWPKKQDTETDRENYLIFHMYEFKKTTACFLVSKIVQENKAVKMVFASTRKLLFITSQAITRYPTFFHSIWHP